MNATPSPSIETRRIESNGVELNVALAGDGPALLLVHGWPHTWEVWREVIPALSGSHRVIAPDLRGLGASTRASEGYDARNLAADLLGLLDAVDVPAATVIAIDAGVPAAFMLAMDRPDRVAGLVLMEAILPGLPGAEGFLAGGPPWWFGFHAVPGLAETVLAGNEHAYIDWFLRAGTTDASHIEPALRDAFVSAYTGTTALRCGLEYYRAAPANARQIAGAALTGRLTMPTVAIGADVVKDALHRQLEPLSDALTGQVIENCGHIVPLDRPDALLAALLPFVAQATAPGVRPDLAGAIDHGV